MTGPVIAGLVTAAVALAAVLVLAVRTGSARKSVLERNAHRFARSVDLMLPADLAEWVGSRIRTRLLAELAVLAPCLAGLTFWFGYTIGRSFDSLASPWGSLAVLYCALSVILGASALAAHEYEWRRAVRAGTVAAQSRYTPRGTGFTPPALNWLVRGAVALGLVYAIAAAAADSAASRGWRWAMIALAAAIPVILVMSEAAQRRIVRAPRIGSSESELLFDDAFRARTVLSVATVPIALSLLGPPFIAVAASQGPPSNLLLVELPIGCQFIWIMLMTARQQRWTQRFFRRYWIRTERVIGQSACAGQSLTKR
jgi:hypothetical protein